MAPPHRSFGPFGVGLGTSLLDLRLRSLVSVLLADLLEPEFDSVEFLLTLSVVDELLHTFQLERRANFFVRNRLTSLDVPELGRLELRVRSSDLPAVQLVIDRAVLQLELRVHRERSRIGHASENLSGRALPAHTRLRNTRREVEECEREDRREVRLRKVRRSGS